MASFWKSCGFLHIYLVPMRWGQTSVTAKAWKRSFHSAHTQLCTLFCGFISALCDQHTKHRLWITNSAWMAIKNGFVEWIILICQQLWAPKYAYPTICFWWQPKVSTKEQLGFSVSSVSLCEFNYKLGWCIRLQHWWFMVNVNKLCIS